MLSTEPISHSRPLLGTDEIEAITTVLESNNLAQGRRVEDFERAMAHYLGVSGGVAVSSGTAALHVALLALGVGPGDEVIMPSYVCAAPWIATTHIGAIPQIVDIEPSTFSIDPAEAGAALTDRTRAIIVPHLFGLPADIASLQALNMPLIEDCAQTLGSKYQGQTVGSLGDVTICSFYATKLLCAGEGGMVLSNSPKVLQAVQTLRSYDEQKTLDPNSFNFKLTELHAALGLCQLARLPDNLVRRTMIAHRYLEELADLPIQMPCIPHDRTHIFYRFVIQVSQPLEEIIPSLEKMGIQCRRPVFQPLHRSLQLKGFPNSEHVFSTALSIPIHPSLTDEEVDRIIRVLRETLA